MAHKTVTISLPHKVNENGRKAAKAMFGSNKKFSTYIQTLINEDCRKRKIK